MNHKSLLRFTLIALLLLIVHGLQAVTTIQVGASQANQTISAAITAAGDITGTGGLIIELQSDYATEATVTIAAVTGASASDPVIIRPAAALSLSSVAWTISGSYITVDGRVGSTGSTKALTLSNTSTSGVTLTISGNNNTVKYVTLQGMNTSATAGVVVFGASTGNIVDYCDIRDVPATGTPTIGIYSASASTNTISNSNIFNYYHVSAGSKGVFLGANTTGWTISGNSFYNTGTSERNYTGGIVSAIYIDNASGNGFSIQNNSIGGQQALCGGNKDLMGLSTAGSAGGLFYKAIYLNVGATSATSVQGNIIQNMAIVTGAGIITATTDNTALVTINNGAVDFGTITGNTIGSQSQIGSITYNDVNNAAKQSFFFGIRIAGSTGIVNIKNNTIGGIKMVDNSYITGSLNFNIINIEGTRTTDAITIEANTIGNSSVGITDGTQMSLQNMLYKLASTACSRGTKALNSQASGSVFIKDNLIANIYGSNVVNAGIAVLSLGGSASYTVNGNTLRDFITASQGSNNDANNQKWNNSIIYYFGSNTKANVLIYGNTLSNLTVANTAAYSNYLDGITIYTSATGQGATIYNNRIYNIYPTGSNASYVVSSGIRTTTTAGVIASIYNNMIRMGYDKSGASVTTDAEFRGISEMVNGTVDAVFNTVLIGGTGVTAATKSSYGYHSSITSSAARLVENNIFDNERIGSSGKHYAIRLANITNTTCNFNNLVSASGYIGNWNGTDKATLANWQGAASGLDANSKNVTPTYQAAIAITPDLHIYTGGGFAVSTIVGTNTVSTSPNTDFDGDARNNYTMGADDNGIADVIASVGDLSTFQTLINSYQVICSAAVAGSSPGQYLSTTISSFQTAITTAQGVHDLANVTLKAIQDATTALNNAKATFDAGQEGTQVNLDALATAISSATTLYSNTAANEGSSVGQYPAASRSTLSDAILTAQATHDAQNSNDTQLTTGLSTLNSAILTFKNALVTDNHALADGYYSIYVTNSGTDYYLSDVSPYTMPANATSYATQYQLQNSGSARKYQEFKLTWDAAKSRYKIEGKFRLDNPGVYKHSVSGVAQAYINESANFGGNAYSNSWNSMSIKYDGTRYAFQRGESGGTDYWKPASYTAGAATTTNPSATSGLADNVIYHIVSASAVAGDYTAFNSDITTATSTLSGATQGDASGQYTVSNADALNTAISTANSSYTSLSGNAASTYSDVLAAREVLATAKNTFLASVNQTFTGSGNWSTTGNWSAGFLPATTATVTVSGGELTLDQSSVTVPKITVNSNARLSLPTGKTLNATNLVLNSDVNGTATFVAEGTASIVNVAANQYLSATRNWYVSSPVTGAAIPGSGYSVYAYDETGQHTEDPAGPYWFTPTGNFAKGLGYIAFPTTAGATLQFSGTLNSGDVDIDLTHSGTTKTGFNLIGNPYPCHLSWTYDFVNANSSLIESSIWVRTNGGTTNSSGQWSFATFNATSSESVPLVGNNGIIAPMQAFWVKAKVAGRLTLNSSLTKSHQASNPLKVLAANNTERQRVRLQVSNGTATDEMLVFFDANAQNGYDSYDSQKMSNNQVTTPEIYSVTNGQKLVMNGLSAIENDMEIPLGFSCGQPGTFTIKATQLTNISTDTKVYLKDNTIEGPQTELLLDESYTFTSDATTDNTSRFSLVIKVPSITTHNSYIENELVRSYSNANGQILIERNVKSDNAVAYIYNSVGQLIQQLPLNDSITTTGVAYQTGTYVVKIRDNNKLITIKVFVDNF